MQGLHRQGWHVAGIVLAVAVLARGAGAAPPPAKVDSVDPAARRDAAALVNKALAAEAQGETEARSQYLQEALAIDPDYPPAHWHSGQVRSGGRWRTIEEASAAATASSAGRIERYRQLRDQMVTPTAADHLKLASACAKAGLHAQRLVHLQLASQADPRVAQRVSMRLKRAGRSSTNTSVARARLVKEQKQRAERALEHWMPRLTALRQAIDVGNETLRESALRELAEIREPEAIAALEVTFADGPEEASEEVVVVLSAIPGQAAVDSLMRHALLSRHEDVRRAAATALRDRSLYSYVPTLMGLLAMPIQRKFDSAVEFNRIRHTFSTSEEGPFTHLIYSREGNATIGRYFDREKRAVLYGIDDPTEAYNAEHDARRAVGLEALNVARQRRNSQVAAALRSATGQELDDVPTSWWNWWFDYNDIYRPAEKPIQISPTYPYPSCFVACTKVWTTTGTLPIQEVEIGELVLSQDPETGELAYKPVLATTTRPSSPLIVIRAGSETIRVTRGHPFWVSGFGWQMAKELYAGQLLHTPTGPLTIESVEQEGEAFCFNLVVADFETYFITDSQVLVHDNNIRQVTTAIVPGLLDP